MSGATIQSERRAGKALSAVAAPLVLLPVIALALLPRLADWQAMWLLAISIYAGLKLLTLVDCPLARCASVGRIIGYLLLWPGMDAKSFFDTNARVARPARAEWILASAKLALGLVLLFAAARFVLEKNALAAGWVGLIGLTFVLHFGLFHILSLGWREGGVDARPIMDFPILALSLADFWGRRWNRAFRDLAFNRLLRPLAGRIGVAWATMVVFLVSGLVHEAVISLPVRGGWGGPTIYFLLQAAGLLIERSRIGKALGFGRGIRGRFICAAFVVAPIGLLFHAPFIRHAILPTLHAIGAI